MESFQPGRYSTLEIRVRAVEAISRGQPMGVVADAYGVDRTTLYRWVQKSQTTGLNRKVGSGRPRILSELTDRDFIKLVLTSATSHGYETDLWTVGRLHRVIHDEYEIAASSDTIWRRLREAGLTYQKPERQYFERDEKVRAEWMRTEVPKIRAAVKKHNALLYFQDEANVSLTAFLGKTWAPRGHTPRQEVTGKRGGVSAMSAINGSGRLIFRLHEKRICSVEVIGFLGQMLKHHKSRHLVVVMDRAPPHTSKLTMKYIASKTRLHVFHLPKYSPDWNPDEKVWNHLKHHELKGHQAKTKPELKEMTEAKLTAMSSNPNLLRGIFFRCCVAEYFA